MELLDLYDDSGKPLGTTIERGSKFENGNIMLSIIFIKNQDGKFLIQKPVKKKVQNIVQLVDMLRMVKMV